MRIVRRTLVLGLGLTLAAGACGQGAERDGTPDVAAAAPDSSDAMPVGAVRGIVRDARTDRPIAGALISAGEYGTSTDESGAYVIPALRPGAVKLGAYRRGFRAESTTVMVEPGGSSGIDVALTPADSPCCTLDGRWSARFELDSAGLNARPRTRSLEGSLAFDTARNRRAADDRVLEAAGVTDLDFAPLLGTRVPLDVRDVRGLVFHGDSVAMTLLPRLGDWALELRGRLSADTIRGSWFQRASCCGAYGRFALVRQGDADRGGRGLR